MMLVLQLVRGIGVSDLKTTWGLSRQKPSSRDKTVGHHLYMSYRSEQFLGLAEDVLAAAAWRASHDARREGEPVSRIVGKCPKLDS